MKNVLTDAIANGFGRLGRDGEQKVLVTSMRAHERPLVDPRWSPLDAEGTPPVVVTQNLEVGVFDEHAHQDRHYHRVATEVYTVIAGTMQVFITDTTHRLYAGDTIIIPPSTVHEVLRDSPFLAVAILANSLGAEDKYIVPADLTAHLQCRQ